MLTKLAPALLVLGLCACRSATQVTVPDPAKSTPATTNPAPSNSAPLNPAPSNSGTTTSVTANPVPTDSKTTTPAARLRPPAPLIDHVRWVRTAQGRELQVYPTTAGRTDQTATGLSRAWAAVLADAADADTPGMYDQFRCHWEYARIAEPDKPTWNLEPWRPAVGYPATVAARCNPGGPES